MMETWALEKLDPLRNERLVIVHDPQRMIRRGASVVDARAVQHGFTVIFPSGNLGFRDQFEQIRDNAEVKTILVPCQIQSDGLGSHVRHRPSTAAGDYNPSNTI